MSKKYYSVVRGYNPGIYNNWDDDDGAEEQVSGFRGAKHKSFPDLVSAKKYYKMYLNEKPVLHFKLKKKLSVF